MRKLAQRLFVIVAAVWGVALLVLGLTAYNATMACPTGGTCDGLGRALVEAPFPARLVLGEDRQWAGLGWFLADIVIFWGSVGVLVLVGKSVYRESET